MDAATQATTLKNNSIMKYIIFLLVVAACNAPQTTSRAVPAGTETAASQDSVIVPAQYDASGQLVRVQKSEAEWRKMLNELEYNVLREESTERSFSGDLWDNHAKGVYTCRGCGLPLFGSDTKFDSGTGWPSFYKPYQAGFVAEKPDETHGMSRIEVECARCGGHLGHVFDDGPAPTGLRYCINSVSLDFVKDK